VVGRVLGTDDATPLDFWVAVAPGEFLQLDDVVALERTPPGRAPVRIYGIVNQVRARHEGARFDSDVFLIEDGVLPAEVSEAAQVLATRFEPEVFVPPLPGQAVRKATGTDRDEALFFDGMKARLPAGLSREDEPVYVNLEFLDGTRGAHVNISGVSGVATKTTYATFLLHSLFTSGALQHAANTKALIFNVKGEDLLFLDHANALARRRPARPLPRARARTRPVPLGRVLGAAPPGRRDAAPDTGARLEGVTSFFWTLEEFCRDELLPFLFTDAQDDRQQYTMVVHQVTAQLQAPLRSRRDGRRPRRRRDLPHVRRAARRRARADRGRRDARRLGGARHRDRHGQRVRPPAVRGATALEHLIRGDCPNPSGTASPARSR
jgi:uncharacterized protein